MKEFIECIAKNLVDKPNDVLVTEKIGEGTIICELRVNPEDIGKHGQTAKSIRLLFNAASAKRSKRSVFQILEE